MRRFLFFIVLTAAIAGFVLFTQPGGDVLQIFGVSNPECAKARWLYEFGFDVPQCTCCAAPPPPPSVPTPR